MVHLVLAILARTRANSITRNKKKQNIMKKLFVSILALAAFAACQSDFNNDVNLGAPQGGSVVSQGEHTIYAEVGIGEETKATYGDDLAALWEENDQIALLQEHADYNKPFSVVNKLNIKAGWGTNSATFNGDISVDATEPRVYHIAYPADAVSFSTTSELSVDNLTYDDSAWVAGWDNWAASGSGRFTYTSTLNITVPTTQNGKWEPYMYVSTEAVASNAIGARELTTLTGAIAIRAFEADGETPKQLKQITITSSDAAIAGAFSGSAISVGLTEAKTGARTGDQSNVLNSVDELKKTAYNNLINVLKDLEPTSTTVTKKLSLEFKGSEREITLTGLENIPMDSEGFYTYYINVAPATVGTLEIEAVDIYGGVKNVVVNDQTFTAGYRRGYNLKWPEAALIPGTIETWYDNWNTSSFELADNTIYARNIGVQGVAANQVLALGVEINGQLHASSAQAGVLSQKELKIEGVSNGTYSICTYAKVKVNDKEKELRGDAKTITVTPIPTATYNVYTSYSKNGGKALRNDVPGNELRAQVDLSDAYIQTNFVKSATFTYDGTNQALTVGSEWGTTVGYGEHSTSITVVLQNGYTLTSGNYTSHVTGIPFTMTTSSNADGWSTSGSVSWGSYVKLSSGGGAASITKSFKMPASTSVRVVCKASAGFGTVNTNFSVEVSGSKIFDEKGKAGLANSSGKDLTCDKTATMTTNSSIKLANSYGLGNTHSRVHSLNITYNL